MESWKEVGGTVLPKQAVPILSGSLWGGEGRERKGHKERKRSGRAKVVALAQSPQKITSEVLDTKKVSQSCPGT